MLFRALGLDAVLSVDNCRVLCFPGSDQVLGWGDVTLLGWARESDAWGFEPGSGSLALNSSSHLTLVYTISLQLSPEVVFECEERVSKLQFSLLPPRLSAFVGILRIFNHLSPASVLRFGAHWGG